MTAESLQQHTGNEPQPSKPQVVRRPPEGTDQATDSTSRSRSSTNEIIQREKKVQSGSLDESGILSALRDSKQVVRLNGEQIRNVREITKRVIDAMDADSDLGVSFPEYFPTEVFKFERDLEQPHVVRIFVLLVAVEGAQVDNPQVYVELPTAQITIEPAQATQTTEDETLPPEPEKVELRAEEVKFLREQIHSKVVAMMRRHNDWDMKTALAHVDECQILYTLSSGEIVRLGINDFLAQLKDIISDDLNETIAAVHNNRLDVRFDGDTHYMRFSVKDMTDSEAVYCLSVYPRVYSFDTASGQYVVETLRGPLGNVSTHRKLIEENIPVFGLRLDIVLPEPAESNQEEEVAPSVPSIAEPSEEIAPTVPEFPEEEDEEFGNDVTELVQDEEEETLTEVRVATSGDALRGLLFEHLGDVWRQVEQDYIHFSTDERSETDLPGENVNFELKLRNGQYILTMEGKEYTNGFGVDNYPRWIRILLGALQRNEIELVDLEGLEDRTARLVYEGVFEEEYLELDFSEKKEDWDVRFNDFLRYLPDSSPRIEGKKDSVVVLYSLNTFEVFECYDKKTLREALIRLTGISVKDGTFSLDHLTGYLLQDGSYELAAVGYTAFTGRRGLDKTPSTATCDLRVKKTKRADIEANKAEIRTKMQERFFDEEGEINETAVEERIDQVLKNRLLQAIQEANADNRFEAILEAYIQVQTTLPKRYRDTGKQVCAYLELPDFFFANEEGVDDAKVIALADFCESGDEISIMQEKLNELVEETFFSSVYVVAEKELQVDDHRAAELKALIGAHVNLWLDFRKEKEVNRVTKAVAESMPGLLMKLAAVELPLDEAKAVALLRVVKALNHTPRLFPAMNTDIQSDIEELAKTTSPRLQQSLREDLIRKKEWKLTNDIIDRLLKEYREAHQVSDEEEFVRLCARIQPAITEANARLYWQGRNGYYNKTKYNEALGRCIQEKQRILETQDAEAIRLHTQLKEELQRVLGQIQGKFDRKFKITELQNLTEQALVDMVMRMVRVMNNPGRLIDNREAFADVLEDVLGIDIDPDDDEELSLEKFELDDDRDDDEEEEV